MTLRGEAQYSMRVEVSDYVIFSGTGPTQTGELFSMELGWKDVILIFFLNFN